MKALSAIVVIAGVVCGCGSSDPAPSAAPTATPTPAPHAFEEGHSKAVREYYDEPHAHEADDDGFGESEADYHLPPRPAAGRLGDAITLTGTNLGVRMHVTVTGVVDPVSAARPARPGRRFVGVNLRLRNTGVAIFESEVRQAVVTDGAGRRARAVLGVEAECSNGFHELVRIDVTARTQGCVLFELRGSQRPRTLQLALEQVPAAAGGRWSLR